MGDAPTPQVNHRVVMEIPGPQKKAAFSEFRAHVHALAKQYGARVVEEVKTKKKPKKTADKKK